MKPLLFLGFSVGNWAFSIFLSKSPVGLLLSGMYTKTSKLISRPGRLSSVYAYIHCAPTIVVA